MEPVHQQRRARAQFRNAARVCGIVAQDADPRATIGPRARAGALPSIEAWALGHRCVPVCDAILQRSQSCHCKYHPKPAVDKVPVSRVQVSTAAEAHPIYTRSRILTIEGAEAKGSSKSVLCLALQECFGCGKRTFLCMSKHVCQAISMYDGMLLPRAERQLTVLAVSLCCSSSQQHSCDSPCEHDALCG